MAQSIPIAIGTESKALFNALQNIQESLAPIKMKIVINIFILLFLQGISAQSEESRFHLQTYESVMSIDSTSKHNSLTLKKYLTQNFDSFILSKGSTNYFQDYLLSTELLLFQNHNLFESYPLECLTDNYEHYFSIQNDSIEFWFGGMNMPTSLKISNDSSNYILFPTGKSKPITIISKINDNSFKYTYYNIENEKYTVHTEIKTKNIFKNTLGIRDKSDLLILLFKNVKN